MSGQNEGDDEEFAVGLLRDFLSRAAAKIIKADSNNDPPDVVVTFPSGSVWGVEVTRAYQRVTTIGGDATGSSEDINRALFKFGSEIKSATERTRKREYALSLEGPSALNSWGNDTSVTTFHDWKRHTLTQIHAHIERDSPDVLRGRGFMLQPFGDGTRFHVRVGTGAHDISSALEVGLHYTMNRKVKSLPQWKTHCDQRWLLILNCYPLAECDEAIAIIRAWLSEESSETFDGVFWSGYPDRTLTPVSRV